MKMEDEVPFEIPEEQLKKMKTLINFVFDINVSIHGYSHDMALYANKLFKGHHNEPLGEIPLPPTYPALLPDVTDANARNFLAEIVQDCKRSPAFTSNIAGELGVLKGVDSFDPEAHQLVLKVKYAEGGHPLLHASLMSHYQGFRLFKQVLNGSNPMPPNPMPTVDWQMIKEVQHADFLDLSDLPAPGQTQLWRYKAIYLLNDKTAGIESAVVEIAMFGGHA